jgi:protein-S-isoprenylcysteine O-methyltransferase Ste14
MNALKLKIPPPIIALITAALMWLVAHVAPRLAFTLPGRRMIAGCLAAVGVCSAIAGVRSFRRAGTTLNPLKPQSASALVTSGIYRRTRNPMYLGLLLVLLGWAVLLSNALTFVLIVGFVLYMNHFQIAPEEAALTSMFGETFVQYTSKVRRWV